VDTDLVLTMGIVLLALSLPSLLSAWVDGRLSRLGTVMILVASGMIGWAVYAQPKGYEFTEIPMVMLGVLSRLVN
jgi:hypothetical protein